MMMIAKWEFLLFFIIIIIIIIIRKTKKSFTDVRSHLCFCFSLFTFTTDLQLLSQDQNGRGNVIFFSSFCLSLNSIMWSYFVKQYRLTYENLCFFYKIQKAKCSHYIKCSSTLFVVRHTLLNNFSPGENKSLKLQRINTLI